MNNRQVHKKAPPGFYTSGEARKIMGDISPATFSTFVKNGIIRSFTPPGRSEAFYPCWSVDGYLREFHISMELALQERIVFEPGLRRDIPAIRDLVASTEGGDYAITIPEDILAAWMRANPQAIHVLRQGNAIIGYVSILALSHEVAMKRMTGEYWNRTIPLDYIIPFTPGMRMPFYIAEMAVRQLTLKEDPQYRTKNRMLGARLINETMRLVEAFYEDAIEITDLYAVGTTPFGIHACQALGMQAIDLGHIERAVRPDRIPFHVCIETGQGHLIDSYRNLIGRE